MSRLHRCLPLLSGLVILLLFSSVGMEAAEPAQWKVGLARAKITPREPVDLAGYASRNHPFDKVDADLYVKALALEDGDGHRAVLITSDLIGFQAAVAEPICKLIEEQTGLKREQVLLNSSHTHTGPRLSLSRREQPDDASQDPDATIKYTKWLVRQTAETAAEAFQEMQPARLSVGGGVAKFVMNRREFTPTGVKLGVNPRGLADRGVPVLRVETEDGKLRAVLFGTACHSTTLGGDHYGVSGDFAGFAQEYVEEHNPDAQAMYMLGCAGSANPYPRGTLAIAKQHGKELGEEVCRALEDRKGFRKIEGPLRTVLEPVALPLSPWQREDIDKMLARRGGWEPWAAQQMVKLLERGESLPKDYRTVVAVWQFGNDLTLVGLPGEVVVDYVPRLEKTLGPLNLWIAAYCNDVFGYIPSAEVLAEGGYETRGLYLGGIGMFSPDVEEILVEKVRELAKQAGRELPNAN